MRLGLRSVLDTPGEARWFKVLIFSFFACSLLVFDAASSGHSGFWVEPA